MEDHGLMLAGAERYSENLVPLVPQVRFIIPGNFIRLYANLSISEKSPLLENVLISDSSTL